MSKNSIQNYRQVKNEIESLENLADVFMTLIEKNNDEWRNLFILKNNNIDNLKRYKFLIAAILESAKDTLRSDLKEFRFAHDENDRNMKELFGKKVEFDLHEYLTTIYSDNNKFIVEEKLPKNNSKEK